MAFNSSTCLKLPNGADRSPDASWIKLERWNILTDEEKDKFPPNAPDFVIELLSPSDSLKTR
jgi:Uma2 family endonuclease